MFFSIREIIDIIAMSAIVGFIFMDIFKKPISNYDPLEHYKKPGFDWQNFYFAIIVVAPAIILHEFAHKFAALSFGLSATFNAAYFWLGIGVLLKLMKFRFIFFVPAFVSISGQASSLENALIAGAGPFLNLALWLLALFLIKANLVKKKHLMFAHLTKTINMFLFIFNMIPIGPFDGATFFRGLLQYL